MYINRCLADGQDLTMELVKNYYIGKRKLRPEHRSFYEYYLEFVEHKRKEGLNPETIRVYMTTYNVMKEFRAEFRICDVSLSLIEQFDRHMSEVNGNSSGGRNPKHKNLRTVILDIQKHGIPVENPYRFFKMPNSEIKEVYLDKNELHQLISYTDRFPADSKEYRILKMYQFSCFCGLRFSDVMDLEWRHVDFQNNLIRKVMIKTKAEVTTPLFPMVSALLLEKCGTKAFKNGIKCLHLSRTDHQSDLEETYEVGRHRQARHLSRIPSHVCHPARDRRRGYLHDLKMVLPPPSLRLMIKEEL